MLHRRAKTGQRDRRRIWETMSKILPDTIVLKKKKKLKESWRNAKTWHVNPVETTGEGATSGKPRSERVM